MKLVARTHIVPLRYVMATGQKKMKREESFMQSEEKIDTGDKQQGTVDKAN